MLLMQRGGLLQQVLQDVEQQLFPQMQRQFDLKGSSHVAAAHQAAAAAAGGDAAAAASDSAGGGDGKALGWWSVTSVHSDLMQKIWRALRIVYGLTACLPPMQLAVFVAQVRFAAAAVAAVAIAAASGLPSRCCWDAIVPAEPVRDPQGPWR